MDINRTSYIFGSFSRRRQSDESSVIKRKSLGTPEIPQDTNAAGVTASCIKRIQDKLHCGICRHSYVEPRVLPCLHTFCTRCLLKLRTPEDIIGAPWNSEDICDVTFNGEIEDIESGSGSAGSGYESEPREISSDGSWTSQYNKVQSPKKSPRRYGIYNTKISGRTVQILVCPTCNSESKLPSGGILALPPNFVLQHRILVSSLNKDTSKMLCDLCTADTPASTRCTTCLISLCGGCKEQHAVRRHALLPLADAAKKGALTLRRQPLCQRHPESELKLFCVTCLQVICRDCCLVQHNGHSFDPICRAAESYVRTIRQAVERVKPVVRQTAISLETLQSAEKRIGSKSNTIQEEVEHFINSYMRAVEEHRHTLQMQVLKARDIKLQAIACHQSELERRVENANDAIHFAEDILAEGTDVEVLSFVDPLLRRLEWCSNTEGLYEMRVSENLKLIKEEKYQSYGNGDFHLYGVISTQCVEPRLCIIQPDGLRGARINQTQEVIIETRDASDYPLCRGGENVVAFLKKPGMRPRPIKVQDQRDGTYSIKFVPEAPGNVQLAVHISGKPIKGSPFTISVRNLRPHTGKWHCCTFCSSGGNKEAECACGGRMIGGYRGCGHGHEGHPGTRHWSCCANTQYNSDCVRTISAIYQFSL